jgi:hypothetical protein
MQESDHRHCRLLRVRRKRPHRCCAAERLFDHFIGKYKQAIWKLNPERHRGREIYSEIEFGRLLHRNISCVALFWKIGQLTKGASASG